MSTRKISIHEKEEEKLWHSVYYHKDSNIRLQLIDHYLSLANKLAGKYFSSRPDDTVEFSDYYQFAVVGLIESVDRYVPGGSSSFPTYASYRIKGAILNGLEKASENRQQIAFKSRVRKERVISIVEGVETFSDQDLFSQMVELTVDLAIGYMLEDSGLGTGIDADPGDATMNYYGLNELKSNLDQVVSLLPERERKILTYHYYYQMNFESIAEILNISKGRVSQIHKRLLGYIRGKVSEDIGFDGCY